MFVYIIRLYYVLLLLLICTYICTNTFAPTCVFFTLCVYYAFVCLFICFLITHYFTSLLPSLIYVNIRQAFRPFGVWDPMSLCSFCRPSLFQCRDPLGQATSPSQDTRTHIFDPWALQGSIFLDFGHPFFDLDCWIDF